MCLYRIANYYNSCFYLQSQLIMYWLIIVAIVKVVSTLDNGLSKTPPMGWMWSSFFCKQQCIENDPHAEDCVSDYLIRRKADKLKAEGYLAAGFDHILIETCWADENRNKDGSVRAHSKRFPNGMKPVADYLHKLGMKLGLSISLGVSTCAGRTEGSKGHYDQDAKTLAEWGVDFVKAEGCFLENNELDEAFVMMGYALNSTGRPMNYLCNWPSILLRRVKPVPWELVGSSCNMWDVKESGIDSWDALLKLLHFFYHNNATLSHISGKGGYSYAGPMKIDSHLIDGNMSLAHMAVYSVMGFPLFLKGPLAHLNNIKGKILKDPVLLSIHQDALGQPGFRLRGHFYNGVQIYIRRLVHGRLAVVFLNTQMIEAIYSSYPLRAFLPFFPGADVDTHVSIHDVYQNTDQSLPFKAMFEVRKFHPNSCLLVIMKVGKQPDQKSKLKIEEQIEKERKIDNPERAYAVDYVNK